MSGRFLFTWSSVGYSIGKCPPSSYLPWIAQPLQCLSVMPDLTSTITKRRYSRSCLPAAFISNFCATEQLCRRHKTAEITKKYAYVCGRNLSRLAYQEDELYDKSYISFLKREHPDTHLITSFSSKGFTLNDSNQVLGPMILLPNAILHWRIYDAKEINPSSLLLFTLLHPKPDILVLGTGDHIVPLSPECKELLKEANISVEVQRTETALATYNFLSVEDRITVGAFCLVSQQSAFTTLHSLAEYSAEEDELFLLQEESSTIQTASESHDSSKISNEISGGQAELLEESKEINPEKLAEKKRSRRPKTQIVADDK
ncbi:uncharacterized protein LOC142349903 [Convolutriloba macropyga]|uniref:uncharacterized protein LOC142349903 n=1 Tax=Convolutriloba macropyga TaxID=536237 RepID=UPI003F528488